MASTPLVIWQFTDGKAGHENQAKGLINAMKFEQTLSAKMIKIPPLSWRFLLSILSGRFFKQLGMLPKPDYLIAVGRTTHLPMLLAKRKFGGQSILLMRSFWPYRWFEHVIIPQHDTPPKRDNILSTHGVLNNVTPSTKQKTDTGIILIGGPSKHYHWDNTSIINQVDNIISASPTKKWIIANSRRTPEDFKQELNALTNHKVTYVDHKTTSATWLQHQLSKNEIIWVSPDSVSMVYESMTSGAKVGCFDMKAQSHNRIVKGIETLIKQKMLTPFSQWQTSGSLNKPSQQLFEAQRAANWILSR